MRDQRFIEQVIEGNNIVSVVEQYLPLKKSGSNFKACCPFHEEKTPSFVVSDSKQLFKCFGCGKGGNVIHFVREMERISFYEALEKLAGRIGLKMKSRSPADVAKQTRVGLLQKVYELAQDYYKDNLDKYGSIPLNYLKERNIPRELIDLFGIGFALNSSSGLYNYLIKNQINKQILEDSGLFVKTQYGVADLFRNRLIFTIHSQSGKPVAFGSRKLDEQTFGGKYINSPTTPIYTKGNELYGFHLTKNDIGRKDSAIITEGYFDLLRLYDNGFTNSVATLGTALTNEQIKLIARYTHNFYLLFDGDLAGKNAAIKNAGNIITAGYTPLIIKLPLDEDADSYLLKKDPKAFEALIDKAQHLTEFLKQDELIGLNEKEKIDFLIDIAKDIVDPISKELFAKSIASAFEINLKSIAAKIRPKKPKTIETKQETSLLDEISKLKYLEERNFLIHLVNRSTLEDEDIEDIDSDLFLDDNYKKIFDTLRSSGYIIENKPISSVLADLEDVDPIQVKALSEISLLELPPESFSSALKDMRIRKYRYDLRIIQEKGLNNELSKDECLNMKKDIVERIRDLSDGVINKTIQRSMDD